MADKVNKFITPQFRVSFAQVFQPKSFEESAPKYSLVMLFDKKADLKVMRDAYMTAATEKFGPKEKWPKNFRSPFRDGDERKDLQGYAGHYYVSASSAQKPGLVDKKLQPIISPDGFYSGCYARAEVTCYAYDKMGNKGVAFGLQNIQKIDDGEAFSGRREAKEVFTAVESSSEDESNYSTEDDLLG